MIVVVCDLTIYRGRGFAGYALLFAAAPVLLAFGSFRPRGGFVSWLVGLMLVVLALKMLWCDSVLLVAVGFALLFSLAASLSGQVPYVLETAVFAAQTVRAGYDGLQHYGRRLSVPFARLRWLNVLLPLAALLTFGFIFILANPNLVSFVSESAERLFHEFREWLFDFSPLEIVFWIGIAWLAVELLRPGLARLPIGRKDSGQPELDKQPLSPAPLFSAFRNMLLTVIALFAVYLVFEFSTLWFREFPEGFYYSGYAHEGADWLTMALGLATIVLSLIFRGRVLHDPRQRVLRKLAWLWSMQNYMLAAAVYNRLFIYINFKALQKNQWVKMTAV